MNATDMTHGIRVGFIQDAFDVICSDLSLIRWQGLQLLPQRFPCF